MRVMTMNDTDWIVQATDQLRAHATTYQDQAFYLALQDLLIEQTKRLEQAQGELDGRAWG
jgi:hypothetical protein